MDDVDERTELTASQRDSRNEYGWGTRRWHNAMILDKADEIDPSSMLRTTLLNDYLSRTVRDDPAFEKSFFLRVIVVPGFEQMPNRAGRSDGDSFVYRAEYGAFSRGIHCRAMGYGIASEILLSLGRLDKEDSIHSKYYNRTRAVCNFYGWGKPKGGATRSIKRSLEGFAREQSEASYLMFLYNILLNDNQFGMRVQKRMEEMNPSVFPKADNYTTRVGGFTKEGDRYGTPSLQEVYMYARKRAYRELRERGWSRSGPCAGEYIWLAPDGNLHAENPNTLTRFVDVDTVLESYTEGIEDFYDTAGLKAVGDHIYENQQSLFALAYNNDRSSKARPADSARFN